MLGEWAFPSSAPASSAPAKSAAEALWAPRPLLCVADVVRVPRSMLCAAEGGGLSGLLSRSHSRELCAAVLLFWCVLRSCCLQCRCAAAAAIGVSAAFELRSCVPCTTEGGGLSGLLSKPHVLLRSHAVWLGEVELLFWCVLLGCSSVPCTAEGGGLWVLSRSQAVWLGEGDGWSLCGGDTCREGLAMLGAVGME